MIDGFLTAFLRRRAALLLFFLLPLTPLNAVVQKPQNPIGAEIKASVDRIKHELDNHDLEIQLLDQKLDNLQEVIQNFRQQLIENHEDHQELVKKNASSQESRLDDLEATVKKMLQDLKSFQVHVNNSAEAVMHMEEKMNQLAQSSLAQHANMEIMQTTLASLADALQLQLPNKEVKIYEVRDGDSLGKIAMNHKTSIKVLKDLNGLTQDKIRKGQKLKLPQ